MNRLSKMREGSDTHMDLAKISFSYPPHTAKALGKTEGFFEIVVTAYTFDFAWKIRMESKFFRAKKIYDNVTR